MSVSLQPSSSLGFKRPLTQVVKRSLSITNHNSQPVAFKVKTTAPKLYCVRPNSGRVEPGESLDVSVMLQALPEEPPLNTKCKDKFLIQSTLITAEKETMSLQAIWTTPEAGEEGKVHQQKLRVAYLPADGQSLEEEDETEHKQVPVQPGDSHHDEPPLQEPHEASHPITPTGEISRENSNEESTHEAIVPDAPSASLHPTPSIPPVASEQSSIPVPEPEHAPPLPEPSFFSEPGPSLILEPDAELSAKYRAAQIEIDRLRATLATMSEVPPAGIRRRDRTLSDAESVTETDVATIPDDTHYHQQEGVPLQVVVIIALGVFIMTYLFF